MGRDALAIGANTFQFFTRNPRGGAQKALDPQDIAAFEDYAPEHGIEVILGYAPYTANPASAAFPVSPEVAVRITISLCT